MSRSLERRPNRCGDVDARDGVCFRLKIDQRRAGSCASLRNGLPMHDDSGANARQLADLFVDYVLASSKATLTSERPRPRTMVLPRAEIVTADAASSTERFAQTLAVARFALDDQVPAVETQEGPVPIDLTAAFDVASYSRSVLQDSVRHLLGASLFRSIGLIAVRSDQAVEAFRRGLVAFLFNRFEARESDDSERPGRLFQVTADTEGLRVHYSPAFLLERDRIFGAPTNPVRSWIHPGNYYFGAAGPQVTLWFDLAAKYEIPRVSKAHLHV